jgi:hypothetical protein
LDGAVRAEMSRSRWLTAGGAALLLHTVVLVRVVCAGTPRAVEERVRGTPTPTFMTIVVRESIDTGAAIGPRTAYAPVEREHEDHATMTPPQKPHMGLWVLDVPTAGRRADAGPE